MHNPDEEATHEERLGGHGAPGITPPNASVRNAPGIPGPLAKG